MNSHQDIKELIYLYLIEQCDADERAIVEEWLKDEDHKKKFGEIKSRFERLGEYRGRPVKVDVDSAWNKVSLRVGLQGNRTKIIPLYARIPAALRIAASVIIILGLYYFLGPEREGSQPQYAQDSTSVVRTEVILAESGKSSKELDLPDGTVVTMREGSQIRLHSEFNDSLRWVGLDKGEAYFDVERDESKAFLIETPSSYIEVLGTAFTVEIIDSNELEVAVTEGIVRVYRDKDRGENAQYIDLKKGEKCRRNSSGLFRLENISINTISWITGYLRFNDRNLRDVFDDLEDHFKVRFEVNNENIYKCRLTAKFKKQELDTIIESLEKTFGITFDIDGDVVIVSGEGC